MRGSLSEANVESVLPQRAEVKAVSRPRQAASSGHPRNVTLLAPTAPGLRNRRTVDSVFLLLAAVVLGLSAGIASAAPRQERDVDEALRTVFGWAGGFWGAAFVCALVLALMVVADVLLRRRWDLARDLLVAGLLMVGAAAVLGGAVADNWMPIKVHILAEWGYPELRLALTSGVMVVVGPAVVRPVRVLAFWLVPLAALGAIVLQAAPMASALGALALGLATGSVVRIVFGTPAGVPPVAEVRAALESFGIQVDHLVPVARQHVGAAEYRADDDEGPLKVRVLGRDAQDTQRVARWWRSLAYRDPPRSITVGRLEQVQHEALATLMATQAGVRAPLVVTAARGPNGDALIATRQPDSTPLEELPPEQVSDDLLLALWGQVARLHAARISHGRLNLSNVLVGDSDPMLVDFSAATLGAPQSALDIDDAELLVASAVLVGPERALGKAVQAGWGDTLVRVLPYLQPAALTPHLRDLARSHEVGLKELRQAAAAACGEKEPDLVQLRRVRPKDIAVMAALTLAAYLLISQLANIGFGTIAHEVSQATPAWAVFALILAQATLIGSGVSMRGGVLTPLPLLPCVAEQSAIKFVNLTVPSSAGRIAMNLRFLQRLGVPLPEAVAGSAVDDLSNKLVMIALFLLSLPFVHTSKNLFHGGVNTPLLTALGIALGIGLVAVLAVPKLRSKVIPPMRQALSSLMTLARDPHKLLEIFGGVLASVFLYAIALGAVCLAYGIHLNLAELLFVFTGASVLSSLIPSPGGIGAAEASFAALLTAIGVHQSIAFAIAITLRLCTFYLPPIWGYASLRWLSRKGYV
jgi:glycosyltransferase 2 family protein